MVQLEVLQARTGVSQGSIECRGVWQNFQKAERSQEAQLS